jgi:hypothetical protein
MNNKSININSIKLIIQKALPHTMPNAVLGISCGYTIDSGDFNYIRATIHATDIFDYEVEKLEEKISDLLEEAFPTIPIFHVDSLTSSLQAINLSTTIGDWAYIAPN